MALRSNVDIQITDRQIVDNMTEKMSTSSDLTW
jgi:hypothetical protein